MRLRRRFGANIVGSARSGEMYVERMARTPLAVGGCHFITGRSHSPARYPLARLVCCPWQIAM